MNVCDKCGYKVISKAMFERHIATHEIDVPTPEPVPAPVPENPVIVQEPEKPVVFHSDEITLRFFKPVEVYINAIPYLGKEIKVKDMSLASEIVRIAREAYGPSILL